MFEDDISMGEIGGLLADIRDMFPVPERGSALEVAWAGAMATPECVPHYVKDCLAAMTDEKTNILRASLDSSDLAGQALETVAEQAVEIASFKAARCAYASEFSLDDEGEPDTGSIHANIRAMKAENAALKARNAAMTVRLLDVALHLIEDVGDQFAGILKQPAPNDAWCVGCNPDNCSGCGT